MPYPSQITAERIVEVAHEMIERDGVEKLSLSKLADKLGVRAPSLYRYFRNKESLLQAVNLLTLQQLFADIDVALADNTDGAEERLFSVAQTLRRFAHAHPHTYSSAMTAQVSVTRSDENLLVQMILPIQAIVAEVSGPEHSLSALRGLFALAHGFSMLELHNQLQRGGDLDAAFADSVAGYLRGWRSN